MDEYITDTDLLLARIAKAVERIADSLERRAKTDALNLAALHARFGK